MNEINNPAAIKASMSCLHQRAKIAWQIYNQEIANCITKT